MHSRSSWSTIGVLLVRVPKVCKLIFLTKSNHKNWTIKQNHLPLSDFIVHGVKPALRGCLHYGIIKSSQGYVKFGIGCWTCPKTTPIYTKETMSVWPCSSRSPKDIFRSLHCPLTWSNGSCDGRGKRGVLIEKHKGHMAKKCCFKKNL